MAEDSTGAIHRDEGCLDISKQLQFEEMTIELFFNTVYDYYLGQTKGRGLRWLVGWLWNKLNTKIRMGEVVGRPTFFSVVLCV